MVGSPELNGREFHLDLDPVEDVFSLEDDEALEELDGGLDVRDEMEGKVEDEEFEDEDVFFDAVDGEAEEEQYPAVVGGEVSS